MVANMKYMFKTIPYVILTMISCSIFAADDISKPSYNEGDKQKNIHKLRELAINSQAETIKTASNYNKAMFDAARLGYGGYTDINVEFDDNDRGLSKAEKASIQNTRRNAAIMREQLKGLK